MTITTFKVYVDIFQRTENQVMESVPKKNCWVVDETGKDILILLGEILIQLEISLEYHPNISSEWMLQIQEINNFAAMVSFL